MRDWESQFREWAKPPGTSEEQRMANAERQIKDALESSSDLRPRDIRVFAQGSYKNNTNVRRDSDVDIAVVCYDIFFPDYPEGTTNETFGNRDGDYPYADFKNDVERALVARFGRDAVDRGNKAFDVHENSYRVEADVAPFFEHRWYSTNGRYISGVELRPDNGKPWQVINWPQQHYDNGVSKNSATSKRFKAIVRVLKSLCNEMEAEGISQAANIPGFLIECLVWNVPNDRFGHTTYRADVRESLAFLFNNTRSDQDCADWGEVSELKYLFRGVKIWTREDAHLFVDAAWDYVGFE